MKNSPNTSAYATDDFEDLTHFADESFDTDDVDLFEFSSEESSPLTQLKSIILSLDWEITDETLQELADEIEHLQPMWEGDKVAQAYLQGLNKIGSYIRTKGARAHINAIKLLLTFFYDFEKIISSEEITGDEITKLLKGDVRKFKILQYQIKQKEAEEAPEGEEETPERAPEREQGPSSEEAGPSSRLQDAIRDLAWEVTRGSIGTFRDVLSNYQQVLTGNKPALFLLQMLQTLGDYIAEEKSGAHPEAFTLLHSFSEALDQLKGAPNLDRDAVQELLKEQIDRFQNLKMLIAGITPQAIEEPEDKESAVLPESSSTAKEPLALEVPEKAPATEPEEKTEDPAFALSLDMEDSPAASSSEEPEEEQQVEDLAFTGTEPTLTTGEEGRAHEDEEFPAVLPDTAQTPEDTAFLKDLATEIDSFFDIDTAPEETTEKADAELVFSGDFSGTHAEEGDTPSSPAAGDDLADEHTLKALETEIDTLFAFDTQAGTAQGQETDGSLSLSEDFPIELETPDLPDSATLPAGTEEPFASSSTPAMESADSPYPDEILPPDAIQPLDDDLADDFIESTLSTKRGLVPALFDTDEASAGFDEKTVPVDPSMQSDLTEQLDALFAEEEGESSGTADLLSMPAEEEPVEKEALPDEEDDMDQGPALGALEPLEPALAGEEFVPAENTSMPEADDPDLLEIQRRLDSFFDDAEQEPAIAGGAHQPFEGTLSLEMEDSGTGTAEDGPMALEEALPALELELPEEDAVSADAAPAFSSASIEKIEEEELPEEPSFMPIEEERDAAGTLVASLEDGAEEERQISFHALGALLPGLVQSPTREKADAFLHLTETLDKQGLAPEQQGVMHLLAASVTLLHHLPAKNMAATETLLNTLYGGLSREQTDPADPALLTKAIGQYAAWLQDACALMPLVPSMAKKQEGQFAYTAQELYMELAELRASIRDEFAQLRREMHHHKG